MPNVTMSAAPLPPLEEAVRSPPRRLPGAVADTTTKSGPTYPTPALRLDAQLGLAVIQFFNGSGSAGQSMPTSRQLAAYRQWIVTGFGSNPLTPAATVLPPAGAATGA